MQITVFGASGRVGQQLVALSLEHGDTVRAFVHSSDPFEDHKRLRVVMGDIADVSAVRQALTDSEAVISALGSWHTSGKDALSQGMQTIIPVMEAQGIQRIVSLTGAGALWSADRPSPLDKAGHSMMRLVAGKILRDAEKHLRLLEASNLDWTCIRSPVMTGGSSDDYALQLNLAGPLVRIPRRAVVQCLYDQLRDRHFSREAPVICPEKG